jgi:hypothetical protein
MSKSSATPETMSEILKRNAILLADDHRQHCEGETCTISLLLLATLLRGAGIELNENDLKHFL